MQQTPQSTRPSPVVMLVVAVVAVALARGYYMEVVETLFPQVEYGSMIPSILLGVLLFVAVSMVI